MTDVKCPLGRLVPAGVPATAAGMTVSIKWSGSRALRSPEQGKPYAAVRISKKAFLRDGSEAAQSLGQGSRNKCDRKTAG